MKIDRNILNSCEKKVRRTNICQSHSLNLVYNFSSDPWRRDAKYTKKVICKLTSRKQSDN